MTDQPTLFEKQKKVETEIPLIRRVFIGVDPGSKNGAITAFIYPPNGMRIIKYARISKHTWPELSDFLKELSLLKENYVLHTIFEKVGSMPQQGVSSTFKFGRGTGKLEGMLIAHGIPYEEKIPRTWQKLFSIKKNKDEGQTSWKNRLKEKAQQIFPDHKFTLEECDSFLIAEYCKTYYKN